MSREWKPGDVVAWDLNGSVEIIYRFMGGSDFNIPEWQTANDGCGYPNERDLRPLVVIDPEDREQVDQLTKALVEGMYAAGQHSCAANGIHPDLTEAALRSLITPPKPEEPTGLGAVVEDAEGHRWTRADKSGMPWLSRFGGNLNQQRWSNIAAVRILSAGWSE